MKKSTRLCLAVLLAALASGCSSTQVSIEPLAASTADPVDRHPEYISFWEAMENLDFTEPALAHDGGGEVRCAEAFQCIVSGELDSARAILRTLAGTAEDSVVRRHARNVLAELLFDASRWGEIAQIPADPVTGERADGGPVAAAFLPGPDEAYEFPQQPVTLPLFTSSSGSPIVEVVVNGKTKKFWLDTGAGLSVVSSDVADECHVVPLESGRAEAGTATSKRVPVLPARIDELRIGEITVRNHPAVIIAREDLEFKLLGIFTMMKIDGIIGWNALRNMAVDLNFKMKTATFRRPMAIRTAGRNLFWLGYPIVRLRTADGVPLNFGLDTGAKTSSIRRTIFRKIPAGEVSASSQTVGSAGGTESEDVEVLPSLALDLTGYRLSFRNIATRASAPTDFVRLDGVLGSDIVKDGRLVFDYHNGVLQLSRPAIVE
jgi:hypothetical protein